VKISRICNELVKELYQEMNITFGGMNKNSLEQIQEKFTNISTSIKEGLNAGISIFKCFSKSNYTWRRFRKHLKEWYKMHLFKH
jgi:hypothetical protein